MGRRGLRNIEGKGGESREGRKGGEAGEGEKLTIFLMGPIDRYCIANCHLALLGSTYTHAHASDA